MKQGWLLAAKYGLIALVVLPVAVVLTRALVVALGRGGGHETMGLLPLLLIGFAATVASVFLVFSTVLLGLHVIRFMGMPLTGTDGLLLPSPYAVRRRVEKAKAEKHAQVVAEVELLAQNARGHGRVTQRRYEKVARRARATIPAG